MTPRAWYGRALAALGALSALVSAVTMWGFTVDDALIPLRYARNLAAGSGYRFDAAGPVTDGVTPLPWAVLLVPLVTDDLFVALVRVKALGVALWVVAAALLGARLGAEARSARAVGAAVYALAIVGLSFPIGAWSASGMETGGAITLATAAAVSFARPRLAAALAGLCAVVRPELVVWGSILAAGSALAGRAKRGDLALALTLALAPFFIVVAIRLAVFGRPAPLALLAKPSDLAHGLPYGLAGAIYVLTPPLALAPLALRRASIRAKTIAIASVLHVLVVIALGGDWMPYARLVVPIAPACVLPFVELAAAAESCAAKFAVLLRGGAVLSLGVALALTGAPRGRHVLEDRARLANDARPVLAGAKVIAALDVGWTAAAAPREARIVDLAGLTDPAIAALPGGHTSKSVDVAMLLERGVDTVVLFDAPRNVELRLTRSALFGERYVKTASLLLGREGASYSVFTRR